MNRYMDTAVQYTGQVPNLAQNQLLYNLQLLFILHHCPLLEPLHSCPPAPHPPLEKAPALHTLPAVALALSTLPALALPSRPYQW